MGIHRRSANAVLQSTTVVLFLLFCSPAFAVLGEDVSSVQVDRAHMNAQIAILPAASYSIHEMRTPSGVVVREFVSPAGQVFGVSWQGPQIPDLRQLLGEHFDEYMQAAQSSQRVRRHSVQIETGDLVFESGGHMKFLVGRAYLRSKLPDGASPDAIR
jgi:hypothetical protein